MSYEVNIKYLEKRCTINENFMFATLDMLSGYFPFISPGHEALVNMWNGAIEKLNEEFKDYTEELERAAKEAKEVEINNGS